MKAEKLSTGTRVILFIVGVIFGTADLIGIYLMAVTHTWQLGQAIFNGFVFLGCLCVIAAAVTGCPCLRRRSQP